MDQVASARRVKTAVDLVIRLLILAALAFASSCTSPPPPREFVSVTALEGLENPTPSVEPEIKNPVIPVTGTALEDNSIYLFCPVLLQPVVIDLEIYQTPPLPEPPPRVSFHDPVFGSCIARLTDRINDRAPADRSSGISSPLSAVQAFNADGSLVLARSTEGFWYLYSTHTLELQGTLPVYGSAEVYWDPVDPAQLYYFKGTSMVSYNLQNGRSVKLHDFSYDFPDEAVESVGTNNGASMSLDGRYWGLRAQGSGGQTIGLLIYDRIDHKVTASLELPEQSSVRAVSLSPYGTYFLAWHDFTCAEDTLEDGNSACGLVVYDQNLENARTLLPGPAPFDTTLDLQGQEVVVYYDIGMSSISMLDLETGERKALWLIDQSQSVLGVNISGRALLRPGWVLISTYGVQSHENFTWMDNSIFATELDPGGRLVRIAHTQSIASDEELTGRISQPKASPNMDFSQIIFTSNWGRAGTGEVDAYLIALPHDWTLNLPEGSGQ